MNRLQQLLDLLAETPNDDFLLFAIAKEYEKAENNVLALQYYEQLRGQSPNYVGTYYHLAKLQQEEGSETEALQTYTEGMRIARSLNDQHAFAELQNAKLNLELGV